MRTVRILSACVCGALAWNLARPAEAQGPSLPDPGPVLNMPQPTFPVPPPPPPPSSTGPSVLQRVVSFMADGPVAVPTKPLPTTPQAPGRPAPADLAAPPAAAPVFAEAAPAGTEATGGAFAPQMLGDSLSYFSRGQFGSASTFSGISGSQIFNGPVAALAGSAFKMADNDSPLPVDRVFLDVNYFTDIFHGARPTGSPDLRLTRYLLGGEKTFLGGDASVEIRVPIFQFDDNAGGSTTAMLGDITLISKFVLLRDSASGWTVSGGLDLTIPTGPGLAATQFNGGLAPVSVTDINTTIWQPWAGFYYSPSDQLYVHGFSSLAIPTNDNVPVVWFNDVGVGYHIYRTGSCDIIPTVEAHLTFPFGHEGVDSFPVGVVTTFDTILGVHVAWTGGTILTLGYGFPWTGPQPFSSELICQINHRF